MEQQHRLEREGYWAWACQTHQSQRQVGEDNRRSVKTGALTITSAVHDCSPDFAPQTKSTHTPRTMSTIVLAANTRKSEPPTY